MLQIHDEVYRFAGAPDTWRSRLIAACWAGGRRALASHRSGAQLHGLPGGSCELVEITCPRWRRARHDGLIVHESTALTAADQVIIDGIPTTSVARTLLDLGAVYGRDTVERALENALRRNLVTLEELDRLLRRLACPGRRGVRTLRSLVQPRLEVPAPPTGSERETLVLQVLRQAGLVEPDRQVKIWHGSVFVGRVDLAYSDARIAIEYDSDEFHTGRVATAEDSARRHRMVLAGWLPITAVSSDLRDGGTLFSAAVGAAIRDRHPTTLASFNGVGHP